MADEDSLQAEPSSTIQGGSSGGSAKLDGGFKRNILIIGGVLAGIIGIVFLMFAFTDNIKKKPEEKSSIQPGLSTPGGQGDLGPNMTQKVLSVQAREAEEAARLNKSYIPKDIVTAVDQNSAPQPGAQAAPLPPAQFPGQDTGPGASNYPRAQFMQQAEVDRENRRREGAARQLESLVARQQVSTVVQRFATSNANEQSGGQSGRSGATASGQSAGFGNQAPPQALLTDALEIYGAETLSPVDTDGTSYVSARITSGKLNGAFLIGNVRLANENVETTFTQMRFNGKTYPIQAIALDQQTATNALEGNIDRKILQRYVMPVGLAVVQGFATAKAQVAQTSNAVSGAGIITNVPAPTTEQARNAGVAKGLDILGQRINQQANQPIAVTLNPYHAIGIMFMQPVALK